MSKPASRPASARDARETQALVARSLRRRYRAEQRFRFYGIAAVALGVLFVVFLFADIISKGWSVFQQSYIQLRVDYSAEVMGLESDRSREVLQAADYDALVREALQERLGEVEGRSARRELKQLASVGAGYELQRRVLENPDLIGQSETLWLLASADVDLLLKGRMNTSLPENERALSDQQLAWIKTLRDNDALELRFNRSFFSHGDSREAELAGVLGAVRGSFLTLLITLLLSFPIGVAAAIYLEEFAPRSRMTDLIEVNINNLAAVPSIVFGLLGLAVFIGFFGMPRSAPLVGGLVLALLTLPTVIIASRASLKAVPPSIREAALGMGASRIQMVLHHVMPLAMPGMLTGTIIGMARALGESAPLLMIGMVAFIVEVPRGVLDPATVLPVQVFLWSDLPERGFVERTSGAIIVLLMFLVVMNATAVVLRNRFEKRW
ncbi:MAG: phosphate ABC transporter permease PstA [Steroidobacteraceae bacterium]